MQQKTFVATVQSGKGEGTFYTSLPWVKRQIRHRLGFTPFPGTLNLKLPQNTKRKDVLPSEAAITINPEKKYVLGRCFKAAIADKIKGAIIVPNISNYPEDIIEFVAPIDLRKSLRLKDNDSVKITISAE